MVLVLMSLSLFSGSEGVGYGNISRIKNHDPINDFIGYGESEKVFKKKKKKEEIRRHVEKKLALEI